MRQSKEDSAKRGIRARLTSINLVQVPASLPDFASAIFHVQPKVLHMSDSQTSSDFGIVNLDACDPGLRLRVIEAIHTDRAPKIALSANQLNDIATYINQLEDALLRFHWGASETHQVSELLKCNTGLDIEARSCELAAMTAADA